MFNVFREQFKQLLRMLQLNFVLDIRANFELDSFHIVFIEIPRIDILTKRYKQSLRFFLYLFWYVATKHDLRLRISVTLKI